MQLLNNMQLHKGSQSQRKVLGMLGQRIEKLSIRNSFEQVLKCFWLEMAINQSQENEAADLWDLARLKIA